MIELSASCRFRVGRWFAGVCSYAWPQSTGDARYSGSFNSDPEATTRLVARLRASAQAIRSSAKDGEGSSPTAASQPQPSRASQDDMCRTGSSPSCNGQDQDEDSVVFDSTMDQLVDDLPPPAFRFEPWVKWDVALGRGSPSGLLGPGECSQCRWEGGSLGVVVAGPCVALLQVCQCG